VNRPVARYRSSWRYLLLAMAALAGGGFSVWTGLRWNHTLWPGPLWLAHVWTALPWIAAAGFGLTAVAILALVLRPSIEIHETHLQVGRRAIPWTEVRRLDQTGWNVPLVLQLTLERAGTLLLIYPGDLDSSGSLLRHLRRYSRHALLDGVPYREFWGEPAGSAVGSSGASSGTARKQLPAPRYPVLRPEDEAEVERLFQRLKTAGHLDKTTGDK
jgi:hypothetical protein